MLIRNISDMVEKSKIYAIGIPEGEEKEHIYLAKYSSQVGAK